MADENQNLEENNNLLREQNRLIEEQNKILSKRAGISEEVLDDNRDYANILQDQVKQLNYQIVEKRQILSISRSIAKLAEESFLVLNYELGTLKTRENILKDRAELEKKIISLKELQGKISEDDEELQKEINQNIQAQIDSATKLKDEFDDLIKTSDKIANNFGVKLSGGIRDVVSSIPGLRKFSKPFDAAAEAARETAANLTLTDAGKGMKGFKKSLKSLGAGAGVLAKGLLKSLGPVTIIATLINEIVSAFFQAEKNTVAIANNLAISKDQAELLRQNFVKTADASGKLYVTSVRLIEAQSELVNQLDRGGRFSEKTLLAQTFLTKRLNMNASSAAVITGRFEAFGLNADQGVNKIIDLNNELTRTGESTATVNQIIDSVAQVSGQVAAAFGFSNLEIAKGVIQVRRFGLNLSQARNIAENLLDFESSISSELETELFLGRDINLNRARAFALQGDIAAATQEVMQITEGLTKEQLKSPLIMKSLASTIGLSVDELQDALLLEKDRGRQMQDRIRREKEYAQYVRAIKSDLGLSKKAQEDLIEIKYKDLKLDQDSMGATREQLEKNITSQQAFSEALDKARDSFTGLVNSGVISQLTDMLTNFLERVANVGFGAALLGFGETSLTYVSSPNYTPAGSYSVNSKPVESKEVNPEPITTKAVTFDDFTIRANPKDTLVMAGGTQFGEETNILLKELITTVKAGGNVYIDGNKAGQALVMSSYKS